MIVVELTGLVGTILRGFFMYGNVVGWDRA